MPQQPAAKSVTSTSGDLAQEFQPRVADLLGLEVAGLVIGDMESMRGAAAPQGPGGRRGFRMVRSVPDQQLPQVASRVRHQRAVPTGNVVGIVDFEGEGGGRLGAHRHRPRPDCRQHAVEVEASDLPGLPGVAVQHLGDPHRFLARHDNADAVGLQQPHDREAEFGIVVVGEQVVDVGDCGPGGTRSAGGSGRRSGSAADGRRQAASGAA